MSTLQIPDDLKTITDAELIELLDRCQDAASEVLDEFCIRVGFLPDPEEARPNLRLVKTS